MKKTALVAVLLALVTAGAVVVATVLVRPVTRTSTAQDNWIAMPAGNPSDWPQWRGKNRDAISSETGLVDGWSEKGPRELWRIHVGEGYSSVAIANERLYTLWDEGAAQFLVCLDALSGTEQWRHRIGTAFNHHYGNGPRSTPLVHEDVVFAVGTGGRLVAANADSGQVIWERDLVAELAAALPTYGYSSSPLMVEDRLLIEVGGKDAAFAAFDRATGATAWAVHNDEVAYSSPLHAELAGTPQVVFWSASGLHALSPRDGRLLWEFDWKTLCPVTSDPLNTGTPILIPPDRLFISSGTGAAVLRVSRQGDAFQVKPVWKSEEMRSDVNTAVRIDDHIYGFDGGILKCIDARTGERQWRARGFQKGSLIAVDGNLIVLAETGELAIVEARPDAFVEKARARVLSGKNWTVPALAHGRLYLRNQEELVCLDLRRGKPAVAGG